MITRNCQVDLELTSVTHVARWDILLETRVCPARGKTCAKCGEKGHRAACCRREAESKKSGRARGKEGGKQRGPSDKRVDSKLGNSRVNQVEYDSRDEPYAFPINFNGKKACEDNVVMVKIDDTNKNMLVDSGAQSTVLGGRQFNNLVKSGLKREFFLRPRKIKKIWHMPRKSPTFILRSEIP